jgi:hypothetical protein
VTSRRGWGRCAKCIIHFHPNAPAAADEAAGAPACVALRVRRVVHQRSRSTGRGACRHLKTAVANGVGGSAVLSKSILRDLCTRSVLYWVDRLDGFSYEKISSRHNARKTVDAHLQRARRYCASSCSKGASGGGTLRVHGDSFTSSFQRRYPSVRGGVRPAEGRPATHSSFRMRSPHSPRA